MSDGPVRARSAFTDRHGGVSTGPFASLNLGDRVGDDATAVQHNRQILSHRLGVAHDRVVWMRQVHGADAAVVDSPSATALADVDALATKTPRLALGVLVADCVPVILADDRAGVVGVAHAGRRGVADGVITAAVDAMRRLGATPDQMHVILGPGICGRCYEVSPAIQQSVVTRVPNAATSTRDGAPGLDLAAGIRQQLHDLGVRHIDVDERCTVEDPALFSYRRNGTTGRQAGVVWLELA